MLGLARSISVVGLMAGALALGGCATQEAVEHAQATADQALSAAHDAGSAAHQAQSTADANASAIKATDARLDTVAADVDHLAHHHEHGTWRDVGVKHPRHHRMPKAETPDGTQ